MAEHRPQRGWGSQRGGGPEGDETAGAEGRGAPCGPGSCWPGGGTRQRGHGCLVGAGPAPRARHRQRRRCVSAGVLQAWCDRPPRVWALVRTCRAFQSAAPELNECLCSLWCLLRAQPGAHSSLAGLVCRGGGRRLREHVQLPRGAHLPGRTHQRATRALGHGEERLGGGAPLSPDEAGAAQPREGGGLHARHLHHLLPVLHPLGHHALCREGAPDRCAAVAGAQRCLSPLLLGGQPRLRRADVRRAGSLCAACVAPLRLPHDAGGRLWPSACRRARCFRAGRGNILLPRVVPVQGPLEGVQRCAHILPCRCKCALHSAFHPHHHQLQPGGRVPHGMRPANQGFPRRQLRFAKRPPGRPAAGPALPAGAHRLRVPGALLHRSRCEPAGGHTAGRDGGAPRRGGRARAAHVAVAVCLRVGG
mmetsp:Transcript_104910/g.296473  ORF Transcript_104910/g.296473 Transcript_104910/m.296473 type:complete len:420 (+) Transcript_104910:767-2026(+)